MTSTYTRQMEAVVDYLRSSSADRPGRRIESYIPAEMAPIAEEALWHCEGCVPTWEWMGASYSPPGRYVVRWTPRRHPRD